MLSGILFAISSVGTSMPPILPFVIFRLIGGMGIGIASMLSPMYISEMAPADIRGKLISVFQLGVVFGILVIYFVKCPGIAGIYDEAWNISTGWRWMFGSGLIPSVVFILLLLTVPESPRWLAKQNRNEEALNILSKINRAAKAKEELQNIDSSPGRRNSRFNG